MFTSYLASHSGPAAGPAVFTDGLSRAFLVGAGLAVVAFIANAMLVRQSALSASAEAETIVEAA